MPATTWNSARDRWIPSDRPMSLGIMIPIGELSHFGDTPSFNDMLEMSNAAKDVGFDALWFADHFSFTDDDGVRGVWECWTTMAAVAAQVPDIAIGPLVACTGFRNPGIIAKMAESIDEISGGRFVLGLGAGWHEPEYTQFGMPFDYRVSRFDDAISIIHGLLRDGKADHEGRFFQANGAVNAPRGPRKAGAPILVGSSGDRMLGLIAEYADAWNTVWHKEPDAVAELLPKVDAACDAIGRPRETLIRTAGGNFAMDGYLERRPDPTIGDIDAMAAKLKAFQDLGLDHFVCGLDLCTPATIRDFGNVIAAFDGLNE